MISITQFPIERYPFALPGHSTTSTPRKPLTPPRKLSHVALAVTAAVRQSTAKPTESGIPSKPTFSVGFHGLTKDSITQNCLFAIEQQNQLCMWLENDLIQTKVLLSSPHLGNLKIRGEQLLKTLTELQEIVMMLSQCQNKVSIRNSEKLVFHVMSLVVGASVPLFSNGPSTSQCHWHQ